MRQNRSRLAVLGLLATGPRTGYEVAKEIATVLSHFWHESDGQIYPVLHQLNRDGLAQREDPTQSTGRQRVSYRITDEGRDLLADWLAEPVQPLPPRQEVLLKLFFGRHARPGDLPRMLSDYRQRATEALVRLEALKSGVGADLGNDPDGTYWLLSMDFGLGNLRATVAWCDTAISTITTLEECAP